MLTSLIAAKTMASVFRLSEFVRTWLQSSQDSFIEMNHPARVKTCRSRLFRCPKDRRTRASMVMGE